MNPWERFKTVARGGQADQIPVALIVDSPWLPGYAGVDTLDYFLQPELWLKINLGLLERFPDVAWIPGFWVEYGMAVEPSAFGARIVWHHDRPPSIEQVRGGIASLADIEPADPTEHGLMPLILNLYANMEKRLAAEGHSIKMVAARGPLAIAGWMLGVSDFLLGLKTDPQASHKLLDVITTTIIRFLHAQADQLKSPEGILVLDDIAGMISPKMYAEFVQPYLSRIFNEFKNEVKVFHNDTPCMHLTTKIAATGCDVFNFSHESDIAEIQAQAPNLGLMGNVPPLDVMVRGTPDQVEHWARECIKKTNGRNLILSAGGGASPGMKPDMLDALVRASKG